MAKTALITGGAKRLGACITRRLHQAGFDVIVHCNGSLVAASRLVETLNVERPGSAICLAADLTRPTAVRLFAREALAWHDRLDLLVNNAARFYPTSVLDAGDDDWEQLLGCNVRAPFILCQQLATALGQQQGSIVNLVDIYADKPLLGHPLYSIAKAAMAMLTRSLARELAPQVRVNGVAPGAILAPADNPQRLEQLAATLPLKRCGTADDIAATVLWLACNAPYITGQIIAVDGGRSLAYQDA